MASFWIATLLPTIASARQGILGPRKQFGSGSTPISVAIGDLDAHGQNDVASTSVNGDTVSVLIGNGDGTLGSSVGYATASRPDSVAIGDLNRDGIPDLVVAGERYPGFVSVLLGTGGGLFAARTDTTGSNTHCMAPAISTGTASSTSPPPGSTTAMSPCSTATATALSLI